MPNKRSPNNPFLNLDNQFELFFQQAMDLGRERGDDKGMPHDLEKEMMAQGLDKSGIANYVPSQRLEWKRYKQYTRSDIMAAIEEVKSGKVFFDRDPERS